MLIGIMMLKTQSVFQNTVCRPIGDYIYIEMIKLVPAVVIKMLCA